MKETPSSPHCPVCLGLTFGELPCATCAWFRDYSDGARAMCNLIHRGIAPETKGPEPEIIVAGP